MVRRLLKYGGLLLLLGVILLAGAATWVLGTSSGARWLLGAISGLAPVGVEARQVEGRIAGDLRLEGFGVSWPGGEASASVLHLAWLPARLLRGELAVTEIALAGTEVRLAPAQQEKAGGAPAELSWPRLPDMARRLSASIEALKLEGMILHPAEGEAVRLESLEARMAWRDGALKVEGLRLETSGLEAEGRLELNLDVPGVAAHIRVALGEAVAGLDVFALDARLAKSRKPVVLSGPLEITVHSGPERRLGLRAELDLAGTFLQLRDLVLERAGGPDRVSGNAALEWPGAEPRFSGKLDIDRLDLAPETGTATDLSGTLQLGGTLEDWTGRFSLANVADNWQELSLAGSAAGSGTGMVLSGLEGRWLGGELAGELEIDWREGLLLGGSLQGRALDPARLDSRWPGRVNLDVDGTLKRLPSSPLEATVLGRFRDSVLNGRVLSGRLDARLLGEDLFLNALDLHGDGFDLTGSGSLEERIDFEADVARFSSLLPEVRGRLRARGWLRWHEGELTGAATGDAREFEGAGLRAAAMKLEAGRERAGGPFAVQVAIKGLEREGLRLDAAVLKLSGISTAHDLDLDLAWPEGWARGAAAGGLEGDSWAGTLHALEGQDGTHGVWTLAGPVELALSPAAIRFSALELTSALGEGFRLEGDLDLDPLKGYLGGHWSDLSLEHANPWLEGAKLNGRGEGAATLRWLPGGETEIVAQAQLTGKVASAGQVVAVPLAMAKLTWDGGGLAGEMELSLEEGGGLVGRVVSDQKPASGVPGQGELEVGWEGIDLALLRPWLPPSLHLEGQLSGGAEGEWLPGLALDLEGRGEVGGGLLQWSEDDEGLVSAPLDAADLHWSWRGDALTGEVSLALADYGEAQGRFRLPVVARLPVSIDAQGAVRGELRARIRERGLLAALLPGLVQESRGALDLEIGLGGTWQTPELGGRLGLADAGAYLPAAGIELQGIGLEMELAGEDIRLERFEVRSGKGFIEGSGSVRLEGWRPAGFQARLVGKDFRIINLPELSAAASPDLTVEASPEAVKVRGAILVPQLLLSGSQAQPTVRSSPDLVVVDADVSTGKESAAALDLQVEVALGDHVLVRTAGVDARLGGGILLKAQGAGEITGQGKLTVEQGIYAAYGVRLDIERGNVLFAGGPVDRPTLDVLALRTSGEVKAGVKVTGTPRAPVVKLYSDPAMPDTDILSYVVFGRPFSSGKGQTDPMMMAAGLLLNQGESASLQDQVKRRVGLDVIEVEAGNGDAESSVVTIGKYLNPDLYLSIGHSLFTNANEVRLRYSLSPFWDLESSFGLESGVDLFYKIEFD
ncbi:translocation/assembly module TamB domain-containing protein [uncultured Desulfuromonas sp.]|uniref:translocation/assembly module TamB domain-containing protein n=1 Tax=uncultured Desulfuromonas sp. TaxID=181013 RepID=UPI00262AD022|nr:translocation/assembly module TamB domain-containing protein [uncultured Desulfuromonas sp.]